jgi:catechol 2,3-dioxygenase-like lactoylglutathione lyase family enzyme
VTDTPEARSECACCAQSFAESELVRLGRRPDVALCADCIDSLSARRQGLVRGVPVLATADLAASIRFWTAAGFDVSQFGDDFASASHDRVEVHLVGTAAPSRDRGEAYIHVRGVDELHAAWTAAGLPVTELRDEPWEMREFTVVDPGGNRVRVGQNL